MKKRESIKLLKKYIKYVAKNSLNQCSSLNFDLIISGGAFNFVYGYGIILYLKELEKQKKIYISQVSGTSSGSLLGLLYLSNSSFDVLKLWEKYRSNIKNDLCIKASINEVEEFVNSCIQKEKDLSKINNKLFITITDITTCNKIIKSKWKNKKELIDDIYSSCYIPYITDKNFSYNNKYIDGLTPFFI